MFLHEFYRNFDALNSGSHNWFYCMSHQPNANIEFCSVEMSSVKWWTLGLWLLSARPPALLLWCRRAAAPVANCSLNDMMLRVCSHHAHYYHPCWTHDHESTTVTRSLMFTFCIHWRSQCRARNKSMIDAIMRLDNATVIALIRKTFTYVNVELRTSSKLLTPCRQCQMSA